MKKHFPLFSAWKLAKFSISDINVLYNDPFKRMRL